MNTCSNAALKHDSQDTHTETIDVRAVFSDLPHVLSFVTSCATLHIEHIWKAELVVEEIIANIIEHGYQHQEGRISITCTKTKETFSVQITDTAKYFNPTQYLSAHTETSVRGRGILLIRSLCHQLTYYRNNDTNILCFSLKNSHQLAGKSWN